MMKWTGALLLGLACSAPLRAQVTGGQAAFEYLRLANSPHISALGGISVAMPTSDIAFAMQNPSLMRPGLHNQLGLNYNAYYSGINIMNLQYGYHSEKLNTSFAVGFQYLNYGKMTMTDPVGNIYGEFTPVDYGISLVASRQYNEHWRYGATLKYAGSALYDKRASALLADVGVNYYDSSSLLDIGIVARNMGVSLTRYTPGVVEPLPFDLQIGISKRFKHIPLRLFTTIHHLYEWDIRYDDPATRTQSTLIGADTSTKEKSYFADKLFRHFIFGTELTIAKRLTLTVAYNHLRRGELAMAEKKGAAGFSFGAGIDLNKFQVHYARSYYHIAGAYNEFGLNMSLNKLFGIGEFGEKINWGKVYPDW
ncbi:MAG: type IX secretion system protein PorQ [Flavipsychrobacter sp.]|nr:type IX secretion system protein PorQ [Flavipsychrobacter sp.]